LSPAHTAISAKHGEPDAQEPNAGSRSTLTDDRKKEVIFTCGFWNGRGHLKQFIHPGLPLVSPQSSPGR